MNLIHIYEQGLKQLHLLGFRVKEYPTADQLEIEVELMEWLLWHPPLLLHKHYS